MVASRLNAALFGLVLAAAIPAPASVVAPYFNDFDSSISDFTLGRTNSTATMTLDAPNSQLDVTITGNSVYASALTQVTNLGGPAASANDFVMSTTFVINAINDSSSTIGFAALSTNADPTAGYYLADVRRDGMLRLYNISTSSSLILQADANTSSILQADTPYTLTLAGAYLTGGQLKLTLSLTGDTAPAPDNNNGSISATLTSGVRTGQYFGLRLRTAAPSLNVSMENFSIAIPEPATVGVLTAGFGMFLLRRRRA